MRFGLVHRIMTDALAALGVLALVASGQFSRWVSAVLLVGLGLAIALRDVLQRVPALRRFDGVAVVIATGVQIVRAVAFDANVLDVLIEFVAALQVIRLASRRGAAHDQQVIVLALVHLIAGTVLGGGLGYGLCFFGVMIVAPGALVLSHLRREVEGNYRQGARDRTGLPVDVPRILKSRRVVGRTFLAVTCLLSIPILVFTAALFLLFPRVGLSLLLLNRTQTGRMIGFSGRVDLGEVGVLRSDPTLAMRVEVPNLPDPPPPRLALHLRGTALDAYDGRAWTQSDLPRANEPRRSADALPDGVIPIERASEAHGDAVIRIELEPIDPPVLFLPPTAAGLRLRPKGQLGMEGPVPAFRGPEGELRYQPVDERSIKYEVLLSPRGAPAFQRLHAADRARYLALPSNLSDRIRELAEEWTRGLSSPLEKARAIEAHLSSEYRYDLASPSGRDPQPLEHFLFESKRGHCEFYSTAMAILLRTLGIPTRNVTGFIGGTYNRFGRFYAVRQGDAHTWVEVYLDGLGWMTFDPTPPADAAPKSDVSGVWAYLRDLIEATSQRWDRHVVGYDLTQQVEIFQKMKYGRRGGGPLGLGWSRRRLAITTGLALVVGGAIYAWLRWRARKPESGPVEGERRSPSADVATALYTLLEGAMNAHGLVRPPGTPPLRHAKALAEGAHPLAGEILDLTRIYLEARFGGAVLTEAQRRDFEQRVRALRSADVRAKQSSAPPELRAV